MEDREMHEMVLVAEAGSSHAKLAGKEEYDGWYCPVCHYSLWIRWQPFDRITFSADDPGADHRGKKGFIAVTGVGIVETNVFNLDKWLEDYLKEHGGPVDQDTQSS